MLTGGCACGAVRYAVRAAPRFVCICHCRSCRHATGGGMVPWAIFAAADVQFKHGVLQERVSSAGVTRGHCARCGTSISYRTGRRSTDIDLTLASLDDPAALKPVAHVWVEDKLPWLVIDDGLPQHLQT